MTQIHKVLGALVLFNITLLVGFHLVRRDSPVSKDFLIEKSNTNIVQGAKLAADNPFLLLGAYPKIDPSYFNRGDFSKELYDKVIYGLMHDDDHCKKVDMYNLDHPEEMLSNKNSFTDYPVGTVPRIAIRNAGNILMKHISQYMPKKMANKRQFHFDTQINNYYTINGGFHEYHEIGKHFLCATQMYNHIPGNGVMFRKDLVLDRLSAYREKYRNQPKCFDQNMFFLPYYRLFNKEECKNFFYLIDSQDYKNSLEQAPIQFLIKQGHDAHKSLGVSLFDEEETRNLRTKYQNGTKCGMVTESLIAQKYISNPFLLDKNNKFDFRIYMLIASTNPLIIYYHDGYLRVSINSFDLNSSDRATHLTNTYLAEKKFKEARKENKTINGMTAKELEEYHLWDFNRFGNYLLESGKISDMSWLDTYLRPLFQKAFAHLIKMSGDGFWKQSNVYELHGLDFMLDTDMNLWFIESNPNPLLIGVKPKLISQMLADLFDIQFAYYRSRMKRMVDVIYAMQQEALEKKDLDVEKWRKAYLGAMKNKLEPEFPIRKNNTFVLVMDESRPKKEAYFGHIPNECVDN